MKVPFFDLYIVRKKDLLAKEEEHGKILAELTKELKEKKDSLYVSRKINVNLLQGRDA